MKKVTLLVIKVGKKLFYNTPVHRSRIVNIAYEKMFNAAFSKDEIVEVMYEGHKFKFPSRDITILPSVMNNNYEKHEIKLLKKVLKTGMTFVDVGANVGLFTIIAAKAVGQKGRIYSFEPEPNNFKLLKENIELNKINNVVSENLAVGIEKSVLNLQIVKNSAGTHSLLKRSTSIIEREVKVKVIKLDDYFRKISGPIHILKIDVEGYEPFVLKGADMLMDRVKYLFFEYNKADVESSFGVDNMLKLLGKFPYIYGISEKTNAIKLFEPSDFYKTKYLNIFASKEIIN